MTARWWCLNGRSYIHTSTRLPVSCLPSILAKHWYKATKNKVIHHTARIKIKITYIQTIKTRRWYLKDKVNYILKDLPVCLRIMWLWKKWSAPVPTVWNDSSPVKSRWSRELLTTTLSGRGRWEEGMVSPSTYFDKYYYSCTWPLLKQ